MGANPKGREAEEMRKHLPAQRARREAPQRPPAQQADPLTAHQSMLKRLASVGRFFVGSEVLLGNCRILAFARFDLGHNVDEKVPFRRYEPKGFFF